MKDQHREKMLLPGGSVQRYVFDQRRQNAINQNGELLLVWTEGTGWQKGGSLAWQLYDPSGKPSAEKRQMPGVPVWSFAAVAARPDNSFVVLY
jgi:hypothetical protein